MEKLGTTLESNKIITNIDYINKTENTIEQNITLKRKFIKLFTENQKVKKMEVDKHFKEWRK